MSNLFLHPVYLHLQKYGQEYKYKPRYLVQQHHQFDKKLLQATHLPKRNLHRYFLNSRSYLKFLLLLRIHPNMYPMTFLMVVYLLMLKYELKYKHKNFHLVQQRLFLDKMLK